jgi:subtilisin family serine protease
MNKKLLILFSFIILIFGIFLISSFDGDKVSEEVYEELEENKEVPVKIEMEKGIFFDSKKEVKKEINNEIINETDKEIIVNINKKELEKIKIENKVKSISFAPQFKAFLEDSVPLINASIVWPINLSNQNITGINETICIIDTGINFSHSDLIGKNKTCIIDCYNKDCIEDCSVNDNNGHGTHVAGIAAANGSIKGVAIDANLIGLRVLDSNGDAHPSTGTADIKNAIDWCVANRITYNISIISMSLGTTTLYTNYCDSSFSNNLAKAINNATLFNISVIVATGNAGSITQISSPACIENSTSVGSIGNDDSTFAYNRNSITDLMAPGGTTSGSAACSPGSMNANRICSTYNNGAYIAFAGTSMSTPHVAGAFALFRQFFRLQKGRVPTPTEIKTTFNSTGKQINDTSGNNLNYSRIDVFEAIDSLRIPVINKISPLNNSFLNLSSQNSTFICNTTSNYYALTNITFSLWNSSSLAYNITEEITGINNQTNFSYNFSIEDSYLWNCNAYNNNSFTNSNSNFTITYDITKPQINLISPANSSTWTSSSTVIFTYNISSTPVANCSLIINNNINQTNSSVVVNINQTFSEDLVNGNYNWSINCTDYANNINNSEERNLIVSYTAPAVDNGNGGGGGGGGGGGITTMTYIPSLVETVNGYTKSLEKKDKIKFTLFDGGNVQHTITLNSIKTDSVNLTIQSNPINILLGIGQSIKLNLSSNDYYDLYIKLNSIENNKADLTIQTIREEIPKTPEITSKVIDEREINKVDVEIPKKSLKETFIYALVLIFVVIGTIILLRKRTGEKKKQATKKEYKKKFESIKPKKKK